MMLSSSALISSTIACEWLKNASPGWNGERKNALPRTLPAEFPEALRNEAQKRLESVLAGIDRYLSEPYARCLPEPPAVWRHGAARLLDYGPGGDGPVVILIPSLINRYFILDLHPRRSFARYLASQGLQVLVLDWGEPGEAELDYDLAAYVTGPLKEAIRFTHDVSGTRPLLAGYCMGGVLALAAAQLYARQVQALALFAAPWDFHAPDMPPPLPSAHAVALLNEWMEQQGALSPEAVLALFSLSDPWRFEEKFLRFGLMEKDSAAYAQFMALEHWVNDGVVLSGPVARECLVGWAQENRLAKGEWKISRRRIDPSRLKMPVFAAVPRGDRIVPLGCALPLVEQLQECSLVRPSAGHVGMVVGSRAKKELWEPFREWVGNIA